MKAEIIAVGTELLLGHIVNTNAAFLSQKLAELGIDVYHQITVGDNPSRLADSIRLALGRSQIVITSGGLGPTIDDITFATVANLLHKRLVLNKTILKDVKEYFESKKVKFPKESLRQAYIPEDVKWVRNKVGTAPGIIAEYRDNLIICLPGPPREMEPMFTDDIVPCLRRMAGHTVSLKTRSIKITGLPESVVNGKVKDLLVLKPPTTVGIYAKLGEVTLKIMAKASSEKAANKEISKIEKKIRQRLNGFIFGVDDQTLEEAVGSALLKKRKTLAIAESCTGGLVANRITNVSGSSKYFLMGMVTYSNESKIKLLGVPKELITKYGAVSGQVANEMAKGIRRLAGSNIGLAITGIAGPTGGSKKKPAGLVFIALSSGKKQLVKEYRFKGTREEVKFQASQVALELVRGILLNSGKGQGSRVKE